MPRSYRRKTNRGNWTDQQLIQAKDAVDRGISVNRAAKTFGIPRTTLADHVTGKVVKSKLGSRETVFTPQQEAELLQHLLDLESRFYGITKNDVRELAFELAEKNKIPHPFNKKKKMAGCEWMAGFLKRNPKLSFRKPEPTSAARARGFNKVSVNAFFDMYEAALRKKNFRPERIYNVDETAISTVPPNKKKIAALKGKKQVGIISSAERGETTTVVMSMSASGHYLPPFVIFPRTRMHDSLKHGAPSGTKFACNPSGYMTAEMFDTFFDHFLEHAHALESDPILLLVDGHSSHTKNLAVTEKARKHNVTILSLPPHCSNKLQPLDVAFMAPFKAYYSTAAEAYLRSNPGHVIGQYNIMQLMRSAFEKAATMSTAVNGFKKCGLWPCDRTVFDESSFAPSLVTDQELENTGMDSAPQEKDADTPMPAGAVTGSMNESVKSGESSFTVTPEEVLPLPKMTTARATKRKRRAEKAQDITSDDYRQSLIDAKATKDISSIKKGKRASSKGPQKRQKRQKLTNDLDDSLCDRCGNCFSDSSNGEGWIICVSCKNWIHTQCYDNSDLICIFCTE
ncbi:uncharacterized protein LOC134224952 isoform X2 [Armigeres subalbatus]|uniref:uncharacterized protein LOC134224952 isoform X2 n=1 Tax=Armigeres subalbatus TaxID=124917 RepID=UPI002ED3ED0B